MKTDPNMLGLGATAMDKQVVEPVEARSPHDYCKDYIRGKCKRENCRYVHEIPHKAILKELFRFCHDFQNKGCFRPNCKFIHRSVEEEASFLSSGVFPRDPPIYQVCTLFLLGKCSSSECKFIHPPDVVDKDDMPLNLPPPPPPFSRPPPPIGNEDAPPEPKFRRYTYEENGLDKQILPIPVCPNCESLNHKVKLLHDNMRVLLNKVADLTEKNIHLTSMNEFLLEQTASLRGNQSCVITSRHGTSAPVSLATVSVTPVVSLAGALPALVPAAGNPNIALAPAASRAQLLTPAPQLLTVSTTQQLVGNPGTLIVTSAGAQQLMQVSDSGTLMGGGQTVVAVTPAQLTLGPTQQLINSAPQTAVQQLVQQSALQPQLAQQASQYAAAQSVRLAAAQQSAQHLVQQSAQHLAAQQSAQLAAQQSAQLEFQQTQHLQQTAQQLVQQTAQQLAQQTTQQMIAQQAQQQLVPSGQQQLVHQSSTQQITISSTSQPLALPNSQAQPMTFPIISQSILPH